MTEHVSSVINNTIYNNNNIHNNNNHGHSQKCTVFLRFWVTEMVT